MFEFKVSVAVAGMTTSVPRDSENVADQPLAGKRLLLVEDNVDNQRLYAHHLRAAGADVEIAADGRSGIERATSEAFSVVFMDLQLPVVDGYEAIAALRAQGFDVPIVALTAHGLTTERQRCFDLGCDEFLVKPVARQRLVETVQRLSH